MPSRGIKFKRSEEGLVLNKDGLPRKDAVYPDGTHYKGESLESDNYYPSHREGSLGEDEESVLI